jgi:RNA polymerase primary sigma factor
MAAFRHSQIGALAAELLEAPPGQRKSHAERLAALLPELQPDRLYAYEYVFHRITQQQTAIKAVVVIRGSDLQHDLGLMLRQISQSAPPNAYDGEDRVRTLEQIASAQRVTLTTLRRWGLDGLPVCSYVFEEGRRRWGVRQSLLDKFLASRAGEAGRRSPRLDADERAALEKKARALAGNGVTAAEIVRKLAEESGRSPSSIRRLLNRPVKAGRGAAARGLSIADTSELVRRYRAGDSVHQLAVRFRRTEAAIYRALHRALVDEVLDEKIACIPSPDFDGARAEALCLGNEDLFTYPPEPTPDMPKAPAGLPPYLAELYTIPLLPREREAQLFRKYNYIKHLMIRAQESIRRTGYKTDLLERYEELRNAAEAVRTILIRCNLRLVVGIAKRHVSPTKNILELVSEGNMCLIRAVECYDYRREARFATYATWAVSKHFARVIPEENYRMSSFVTGQQERLNLTGDGRESPMVRNEFVEHLRALIANASTHLTDRERTVIQAHYGTDGAPEKTLEEIGRDLRLTRERVRQIESRAIEKLRRFITPEKVEGSR